MWTSFKRNFGKVVGGLVGLSMALLLIFAWPLVLIFFLVVAGVFLGGVFDAGRRIGDFLDRILPRGKSPKDEDETG